MGKPGIKYHKWLLVCLLLLSISATAQELLYQKINHANGLPANSVYRIIQDRNGYLWMATEQGVVRYNGETFLHYTRNDGLSDNDIVVLKEAPDGKIWFFGYNGSACYWFNHKIYNAENDSFLRRIVTNYSFNDFFEDSQKRQWFLSIGNTILADPKNKELHTNVNYNGCAMYYNWGDTLFSFKLMRNVSKLIVNGVPYNYNPRYLPRGEGFPYRNAAGEIYFFSNEYLVLQRGMLQKPILKLNEKLRRSKTLCISISKDGYIWIASQFGLYCYLQHDLTKAPRIYLPEISFTMVFTDNEDNVWVNTPGDGIIQIPSITRQVQFFNPQTQGLNARSFSIGRMQDGNIGIGLNHAEWMLWNPQTNAVQKFVSPKRSSEKCYLLQTAGADLWLGMPLQILHYNAIKQKQHIIPFYANGKKRNIISVLKSFAYLDGEFFIAGKHGIYEWHAGESNSKSANCNCYGEMIWEANNKVYAAYYAKNKTLWLGTDSGLYARENGSTRNCSGYHPLLKERINCMAETADSLLILGTNGMGILVYHNGKILQHLPMKEGNGSSFCKKIVVENKLVYVLTLNGLFVFNAQNGLLHEEPSSAIFSLFQRKEINDFYVHGNEIGMAGSQGVYYIHNRFSDTLLLPPKTYIEKVQLQDSAFSLYQKLQISYPVNALRFSFISIHYQMPSRVNYRYRLSPQSAWIYTQHNFADLTQIEPGDYLFEVEGRIGQGQWSKAAVFPFEIIPPFYRRWWFVALCFIAIAFFTAFGARRYFKAKLLRKEAEDKIKLRMNELEQQALLTMMNPHFLFNVMNSIQSFINHNNPMQANQYLSDFAKLIRLNLDISHKKFISLAEEIAYLKLYIHFENLRLQKNINFEIKLNPGVDEDEMLIPAMLIQPFVENAIWHGLRGIAEEAELKISFSLTQNQQLQVEVQDNGIGIPEEMLSDTFFDQPIRANGLSITIQRICLLHQQAKAHGLIWFSHVMPHGKYKGSLIRFILPV